MTLARALNFSGKFGMFAHTVGGSRMRQSLLLTVLVSVFAPGRRFPLRSIDACSSPALPTRWSNRMPSKNLKNHSD
jgi:hypothetical protein